MPIVLAGAFPNLEALGLHPHALAERSVPASLANKLLRLLASSAAAFTRTVAGEQARLEALARGAGPGGGGAVPLADRLLAFVTGCESQLGVSHSHGDDEWVWTCP